MSRNQENARDMLPPKSLGIDYGAKYDRLRSIMNGEEITPEDYELLLLLDTNNKKRTLIEKENGATSTIVVKGVSEGSKIDGTCVICLESLSNVPVGTEIRCLPCGHRFCKECIDHWFAEIAAKCPTLSCYWKK
jgi:hypothetical protein